MIKTMSLTLACAFVLATGCAEENGKPVGPSATNDDQDSGLSTDQDPATVYEQPAP